MENGSPPEWEWKREWDFRYDIKNSLNGVRRPGAAVTELYEWIESCVLAIAVIQIGRASCRERVSLQV